jgi:hypothetical protein
VNYSYKGRSIIRFFIINLIEGEFFNKIGRKLIRLKNENKKSNNIEVIYKKDTDLLTKMTVSAFDDGKNRGFLQSVFKELLNFDCIDLYIHGSQADKDVTAFSDFDDLIIIDFDKIENKKSLKKALNKVDMRFCRLDFLQHHGHFIISKNSLSNYDESIIPLLVINDSVVIKGCNNVSYYSNINYSKSKLISVLSNSIEGIIVLSEKYFKSSINLYQLKELVGIFVLIPAIIFQIKGEMISKKEAIFRASEIFNEQSLNCINWSTYCRENWHRIYDDKRVLFFKKTPFFFRDPFLYRWFANRYAPIVSLNKLEFDFLQKKHIESYISIINSLVFDENNKYKV